MTSTHKLQTRIQGHGPALLCLHGHPGSGDCMTVFSQPLSRHFTTFAPDLRGYGQSKTSRPFAMDDHLRDLEALLAQHQLDQCIILGWSLGGILALELALRYPERVRGLILVASSAHPWGDHPKTGWTEELLTGIAGLVNLMLPGWRCNIEQLGKRSLLRYLIQQHTPETYRYLARYAVPAFLQTSRHATQALSQALGSRYNRLPDLPQVRCPCLVLAGECDRHITAASSLETAQALPHCEAQVYAKTAHLFPWEIPNRVTQDVETWLRQQGLIEPRSDG